MKEKYVTEAWFGVWIIFLVVSKLLIENVFGMRFVPEAYLAGSSVVLIWDGLR